MAIPTSATASAGPSLMPSPTNATRRPWRWRSATISALRDAELVGDPLGGWSVVAGDQHGSRAERVQARDDGSGVRAQRVLEGEQPGGL